MPRIGTLGFKWLSINDFSKQVKRLRSTKFFSKCLWFSELQSTAALHSTCCSIQCIWDICLFSFEHVNENKYPVVIRSTKLAVSPPLETYLQTIQIFLFRLIAHNLIHNLLRHTYIHTVCHCAKRLPRTAACKIRSNDFSALLSTIQSGEQSIRGLNYEG